MRTCAPTSAPAELRAANSTAEAARLVSEDSAPAPPRSRRASPPSCTGSRSSRLDIADHPGNQTRFVLVARERRAGAHRARPHGAGHLPARRRARQPDLDPAGVRRAADQPVEPAVAARPRTAVWATTASSSTPTATSATSCWPMRCARCAPSRGEVKFLGSYPAAGEHAHVAREHADARWREADDWINALRAQIP